MSSGTNTNSCFTDFAIQEYLLGRLDAGVREELEAHLKGCRECTACSELLAKETATLRAGLRGTAGVESTAPGIDDETLAMYFDDSLSLEMREEIERNLAQSPEALRRLNELRLELESLRDGSKVLEGDAAKPEGRVLRMPKRQILPRKLSDLPSEGSEVAEG